MTTIQRLVKTGSGNGIPDNLYYRDCKNVDLCEKIYFNKKSNLCLHSYFNTFSLSFWKSRVNYKSIALELKAKGDFVLNVILKREDGTIASILSKRLDKNIDYHRFEGVFSSLGSIDTNEVASIILKSETGGYVEECNWITTDNPQKVKVGIIITHFNRIEWVIPAVERLKKEILKDEYFGDKAELVIVDNSCNIGVESSEKITVLPLNNMGCSGGFARGMKYLIENEGFTHGLFMDDDATCEAESIKRLINIFQYSKINNEAVAGALFCEPEFSKLWECGASWTTTWNPNHHGIKPTGINILKITNNTKKTTYGGWWFFGFKLHDNLKWPFPFFLRGDDVTFSISNNFKVITPLGIACWGDSFALKDSPYLKYLDARLHTITPVVFSTTSVLNLLKTFKNLTVSLIGCYRYDSAAAFLQGVRDSLSNEIFWIENFSIKKIRSRITKNIQSELYTPHGNLVVKDWRNKKFKETLFRKILRKGTLGGLLIPRFLMSTDIREFRKDWGIGNKYVFPCSKIMFTNDVNGSSWIASKNTFRAIAIYIELVYTQTLILSAWIFKKKHYINIYNSLTTKESWDKIFKVYE